MAIAHVHHAWAGGLMVCKQNKHFFGVVSQKSYTVVTSHELCLGTFQLLKSCFWCVLKGPCILTNAPKNTFARCVFHLHCLPFTFTSHTLYVLLCLHRAFMGGQESYSCHGAMRADENYKKLKGNDALFVP
jgi:hypothetical protein